ncbi:LuxR C-terminal-related transcriptional regulator [Rhodococcus sp. G-MC3]|uniref:response regulator transcription factor n=1 Tax=Rhodococcus sp. G-MC3 TaxID=3046209 RepID=UPI0024BB64F8|nr:LuxR C-terminal-related transcriptional regulator [Rhodococcus sp. G-MC3]MDJ0396478.1 LuxR C-terminal-related transcriptional regulator [Rhodococcus sp. G-MC3]
MIIDADLGLGLDVVGEAGTVSNALARISALRPDVTVLDIGLPDTSGPLFGLTEHERTILGLIGEGLTNRQIAERMFLAEKTVKNKVSRLLAELGMDRRTQAALLASKLA